MPIKEIKDFKRVFFLSDFVHRRFQTGNHIGQMETDSHEVNYDYQPPHRASCEQLGERPQCGFVLYRTSSFVCCVVLPSTVSLEPFHSYCLVINIRRKTQRYKQSETIESSWKCGGLMQKTCKSVLLNM